MAKKLFVGNLSFNLTQDQFKDIFAAYGTVISANIVMDKFSGRSKGFGFVEFENDADAMKAMEGLNNSEQAGRNIAVKEAIARPEAPVADVAPVMETPVTETPVVEETATEEPVAEEPAAPEEPAA
jgi:RNA recognition motif-containing protein